MLASSTALLPVAIAAVVAITRLVAFAIDDHYRWRRFRNLALSTVFLVLVIAAAAAWWLLYDGGLLVILHDFGPGGVPRLR